MLYDADPDLAKIGNKSFISARGCPYKCTYCFNKQYNDNYKGKGQILRVRSPQLVVDEIERVKNKYPLDTVTFTDDIFTLRPSGWIVEFADLYKKRIGLPFNITARASSVKKEEIEYFFKSLDDVLSEGVNKINFDFIKQIIKNKIGIN